MVSVIAFMRCKGCAGRYYHMLMAGTLAYANIPCRQQFRASIGATRSVTPIPCLLCKRKTHTAHIAAVDETILCRAASLPVSIMPSSSCTCYEEAEAVAWQLITSPDTCCRTNLSIPQSRPRDLCTGRKTDCLTHIECSSSRVIDRSQI